MNTEPKREAFLVLVTWPDGTEGLLFPRPGNVPIADTVEKGLEDFNTARQHLDEYITQVKEAIAAGVAVDPKSREMMRSTLRLIKFERGEVLHEHKAK